MLSYALLFTLTTDHSYLFDWWQIIIITIFSVLSNVLYQIKLIVSKFVRFLSLNIFVIIILLHK